MSKKTTPKRQPVSLENSILDIGMFLRNYDDRNSNSEVYYLRKSHILSPRDEFIDLTEDEYTQAMERTKELWVKKKKQGEPMYPNGEVVRNEIRNPKKPLLIIYFLDPDGANRHEDEMKINEPIVGFAISFPGSKFNASVSYKIPEQLLPYFDQDFEFEQEEEVDDED